MVFRCRLWSYGRCCAALLAWLLGLVALPAIGPELPSTDDQVVAPAPAVNEELPAQRLVVLIAHRPQAPPAGLEAAAASSFSQPVVVIVATYDYDGTRVRIRGYVGTSDPVNRWDPSGLWDIEVMTNQASPEPGEGVDHLYLQMRERGMIPDGFDRVEFRKLFASINEGVTEGNGYSVQLGKSYNLPTGLRGKGDLKTLAMDGAMPEYMSWLRASNRQREARRTTAPGPQGPQYSRLPRRPHLHGRPHRHPAVEHHWTGNLGQGMGALAHTQFSTTLFVDPTSANPNEVMNNVYESLQDFRFFAGNSSATLRIVRDEGRDPLVLFDASGIPGGLMDYINENEVPVALLYDDDSRVVTGVTLDGHMLAGVRKWGVARSDERSVGDEVAISLWTESYEQRSHLGNNVGLYLGGEEAQAAIWVDYINDVAAGASRQRGVRGYAPLVLEQPGEVGDSSFWFINYLSSTAPNPFVPALPLRYFGDPDDALNGR